MVINRLQIHNVSVIHGRAEELGQDENFRNQFDYVVSRAVAELPVLLEYCIPFVKKEDTLYLIKAEDWMKKLKMPRML